jgi:uncharacterized protein
VQARKIFHVSPFQPVEGGYDFRFDIAPTGSASGSTTPPGTAGFWPT